MIETVALANAAEAYGRMMRNEARFRIVLAGHGSLTWLHFMLEFPGAMVYLLGMSQTLEQRVEDLEKKVAELSAEPTRPTRKKDWRRTIGIFKEDPDFEEAVRLGREYRQQQTYEKEIAGS